MDMQNLIPILQVAIGPVILVSGVGLLLLSMTNRFGRIIDRSRQLVTGQHPNSEGQIEILLRRARLLRAAILLATVSVLLAAMMIIGLFLGAMLTLNLAWLVALLFVACMLSLTGALLFFMADLNLSLHALRMELGR